MTTGGDVTNELAEIVGPCWSEAKVASVFEVSATTIATWRRDGFILGLSTREGHTEYPIWQFHQDDERARVRSALQYAFKALREFDPWAVAVLLHTPSPELRGQTPLGWLSAGADPDDVADLAGVVAREWAAGSAPTAT